MFAVQNSEENWESSGPIHGEEGKRKRESEEGGVRGEEAMWEEMARELEEWPKE